MTIAQRQHICGALRLALYGARCVAAGAWYGLAFLWVFGGGVAAQERGEHEGLYLFVAFVGAAVCLFVADWFRPSD